MSFIKSFDGTKIYYRFLKNKKSNTTLVFIHGLGANWTVWKKEIEFFKRKEKSILYLDLRGHGQSGKPDNKRKYSMQSFAKDIHQVVKKEKLKNIILIGHSMGGMIVLSYYKSFKRNVKSLVLTDTTYRNVLMHKKIRSISPLIKHFLDFLIDHEHIKNKHFSHLKDVDLTKYQTSLDYYKFYKGLYNTPMKSVFSCIEAMMKFNATSLLSKIKIPILIIEGSNDTLIPKIDSLEMYKKIKNSEIDFIPNGKHYVDLNAPKLVDKFIFRFLIKHKLISN